MLPHYQEQDLRTQEFTIRSNQSLIEQSERKIAQIVADYRRALQTERVEAAAQAEKAQQELAKHEHRFGLLELRAPQPGVVKDLATHTIGTVASPGTILMTLVPEAPSPNTRSDALTGRDRPMGPLAFRALVDLNGQELVAGRERYRLGSGMQVAGEIHLGTRSILEYVLSPVQKAWHEAGRER